MDRYKMIKPIGDGSFGSVMQAVDSATGSLVAVKQMKQKFGTWEECIALREVRSLRKLYHPNIVRLKEVIRESERLNFVFEYMDQNLYQVMRERHAARINGRRAVACDDCGCSNDLGYFCEDEIRWLIFQVLCGLAYMQKKGFFHRDMKPENLLITGLHVKIADFGLAREIKSRPPYTDYVSTRWYRAPEVILRSSSYSSPIDFWALGCIMAELYTNQPLFPGSGEIDQVRKILSVLGTPGKTSFKVTDGGGGEWFEGVHLASKLGLSLAITKPRPLSTIVPNASWEALDLMRDFLKYDPSQRPSAADALQYPFFYPITRGRAPGRLASLRSGGQSSSATAASAVMVGTSSMIVLNSNFEIIKGKIDVRCSKSQHRFLSSEEPATGRQRLPFRSDNLSAAGKENGSRRSRTKTTMGFGGAENGFKASRFHSTLVMKKVITDPQKKVKRDPLASGKAKTVGGRASMALVNGAAKALAKTTHNPQPGARQRQQRDPTTPSHRTTAAKAAFNMKQAALATANKAKHATSVSTRITGRSRSLSTGNALHVPRASPQHSAAARAATKALVSAKATEYLVKGVGSCTQEPDCDMEHEPEPHSQSMVLTHSTHIQDHAETPTPLPNTRRSNLRVADAMTSNSLSCSFTISSSCSTSSSDSLKPRRSLHPSRTSIRGHAQHRPSENKPPSRIPVPTSRQVLCTGGNAVGSTHVGLRLHATGPRIPQSRIPVRRDRLGLGGKMVYSRSVSCLASGSSGAGTRTGCAQKCGVLVAGSTTLPGRALDVKLPCPAIKDAGALRERRDQLCDSPDARSEAPRTASSHSRVSRSSKAGGTSCRSTFSATSHVGRRQRSILPKHSRYPSSAGSTLATLFPSENAMSSSHVSLVSSETSLDDSGSTRLMSRLKHLRAKSLSFVVKKPPGVENGVRDQASTRRTPTAKTKARHAEQARTAAYRDNLDHFPAPFPVHEPVPAPAAAARPQELINSSSEEPDILTRCRSLSGKALHRPSLKTGSRKALQSSPEPRGDKEVCTVSMETGGSTTSSGEPRALESASPFPLPPQDAGRTEVPSLGSKTNDSLPTAVSGVVLPSITPPSVQEGQSSHDHNRTRSTGGPSVFENPKAWIRGRHKSTFLSVPTPDGEAVPESSRTHGRSRKHLSLIHDRSMDLSTLSRAPSLSPSIPGLSSPGATPTAKSAHPHKSAVRFRLRSRKSLEALPTVETASKSATSGKWWKATRTVEKPRWTIPSESEPSASSSAEPPTNARVAGLDHERPRKTLPRVVLPSDPVESSLIADCVPAGRGNLGKRLATRLHQATNSRLPRGSGHCASSTSLHSNTGHYRTSTDFVALSEPQDEQAQFRWRIPQGNRPLSPMSRDNRSQQVTAAQAGIGGDDVSSPALLSWEGAMHAALPEAGDSGTPLSQSICDTSLEGKPRGHGARGRVVGGVGSRTRHWSKNIGLGRVLDKFFQSSSSASATGPVNGSHDRRIPSSSSHVHSGHNITVSLPSTSSTTSSAVGHDTEAPSTVAGVPRAPKILPKEPHSRPARRRSSTEGRPAILEQVSGVESVVSLGTDSPTPFKDRTSPPCLPTLRESTPHSMDSRNQEIAATCDIGALVSDSSREPDVVKPPGSLKLQRPQKGTTGSLRHQRGSTHIISLQPYGPDQPEPLTSDSLPWFKWDAPAPAAERT